MPILKSIESRKGDQKVSFDTTHVVRDNKVNKFSKSQILQSEITGTSDQSQIEFHSETYDRTSATFDGSLADSYRLGSVYVDNSGNVIGSHYSYGTSTASYVGMQIYTKENSPVNIELGYNRSTGVVTAYGPSTDSAAINNELATANYVIAKDTALQTALTESINTVNQDLSGKVNTINATAAFTNKSNTFLAPQVMTEGLQLSSSDNFDTTSAVTTHVINGYTQGVFDNPTITTYQAGEHYLDKSGNFLGLIGFDGNASARKAYLSAVADDNATSASIVLNYDRGANTFTASAPTTAESANANEIAVASWVKKRISELQSELNALIQAVSQDLTATKAHTAYTDAANQYTQDQSMPNLSLSGKLTIAASDGSYNSPIISVVPHSTIAGGATATHELGMSMQAADDPNLSFGWVGMVVNGNTRTSKLGVKDKAGADKGFITISYDANADTLTTSAPTPPTADKSTQIATTAYVQANAVKLKVW